MSAAPTASRRRPLPRRSSRTKPRRRNLADLEGGQNLELGTLEQLPIHLCICKPRLHLWSTCSCVPSQRQGSPDHRRHGEYHREGGRAFRHKRHGRSGEALRQFSRIALGKIRKHTAENRGRTQRCTQTRQVAWTALRRLLASRPLLLQCTPGPLLKTMLPAGPLQGCWTYPQLFRRLPEAQVEMHLHPGHKSKHYDLCFNNSLTLSSALTVY